MMLSEGEKKKEEKKLKKPFMSDIEPGIDCLWEEVLTLSF